MNKFVSFTIIILAVFGSVTFAFADIKETAKESGGPGLQNVHDRVLCVEGFKVFQTIVFGFKGDGGTAVSNIQLMEEKSGNLVPARCSKE